MFFLSLDLKNEFITIFLLANSKKACIYMIDRTKDAT